MFSRTHTKGHSVLLIFMDIICLAAGCVAAIIWRFPQEEWLRYFEMHTTHWVVMLGSMLLANALAGSYKVQYSYSRFNLVVTWLFSLAFVLVFLTLASYMRMINPLGRGVILRIFLVYSVLILTLKLLFYRRIFRSSAFICRTVILGSGRKASDLKAILESGLILPRHRVVAFLDMSEADYEQADDLVKDGAALISCDGKSLEEVVKSLGADLIVVAFDNPHEGHLYYPRLRKLRFDGIEVLLDTEVSELYRGRTPLEHLDEEFLLKVSTQSGLPSVRRVKRFADIALASIAIVLLSPLMLLIYLIIKLSDVKNPAMYSQIRCGQFGVPFRIYKFRTMRVDAEEESGVVWAKTDDPRITKLGGFLRKFRLDEMPQIINIIKGEMSIVGPRPERPEMSEKLAEQIPYYRERENVPPGLTGWAQVRHPYGDSLEDTKNKLEYDLFYIKNMSLALDLQIILSTIRIIVLGLERER